jgi:hypothetical protein
MPELTLDYVKHGSSGAVALTARLGDEVLAHDTLDLGKAKARTAFAAAVCLGRNGIDLGAVENELTRLAAEQAASRNRQTDDDAESDRNEAAELLAKMPDSTKAEARAMLESPKLVERVVQDIGELGVAGEKALASTIYLVGMSRLLPRPLAAIVQGLTSSGKSYIIEKCASLFPPEGVLQATAMTPQALFHLKPGSLENKFVVAGERSRLENDERAEATRALREMLSSGRLVKLMPVKIAGEIRTVQIVQEGPIAFVESTTLSKIFDEDANRCLLLTTDERTEQTKRIVATLARGYSGIAHDGVVQAIIDRHHALQRMLQPFTVVVPFAGPLGELLAHDKVEARRAFPQLISMVQASALLHQYQRKIDDDGRLIAAQDDYQLARHLLLKPLGRLLGGKISDPAVRFHERLITVVTGTFTTRDIAKRETASDRAVRGWLVELHDAGKVDLIEDAKGPKPAIWKLAKADGAQEEPSDLPELRDLFPDSAVPTFRQVATA